MSFSSLLEKLSGCGTAAAPDKAKPREARRTVSSASAEVAETSYKAWPAAAPQPWQGAKARTGKRVASTGGSSRRGAKAQPLEERPVRPASSGYESWGVDEQPGEPVTGGGSEPGMANVLRRSVVSIRLKEEEMALLRQRAAESGISISEYVRSCVVEADQLRVQVKQVVADMRFGNPVGGEAGTSESAMPEPKRERPWFSKIAGLLLRSARVGRIDQEKYSWAALRPAEREVHVV
jgi:hypothetical protein